MANLQHRLFQVSDYQRAINFFQYHLDNVKRFLDRLEQMQVTTEQELIRLQEIYIAWVQAVNEVTEKDERSARAISDSLIRSRSQKDDQSTEA